MRRAPTHRDGPWAFRIDDAHGRLVAKACARDGSAIVIPTKLTAHMCYAMMAIAQCCSSIDASANVGDAGDCLPNRARYLPQTSESGRIRAASCRNSADASGHRGTLARIGPNFGRDWQHLGRCRPDLAGTDQVWAALRQDLFDSDGIGTNFGQHGPFWLEWARFWPSMVGFDRSFSKLRQILPGIQCVEETNWGKVRPTLLHACRTKHVNLVVVSDMELSGLQRERRTTRPRVETSQLCGRSQVGAASPPDAHKVESVSRRDPTIHPRDGVRIGLGELRHAVHPRMARSRKPRVLSLALALSMPLGGGKSIPILAMSGGLLRGFSQRSIPWSETLMLSSRCHELSTSNVQCNVGDRADTRKLRRSCSPHIAEKRARRTGRAPKLSNKCGKVVELMLLEPSVGPNLTKNMAAVDQTFAHIFGIVQHIGQLSKSMATCLPISARFGRFWSHAGRCWPTSENDWPNWANIGQIVADVWPSLGNCQHCHSWTIWAEFGQELTRFGKTDPVFGQHHTI